MDMIKQKMRAALGALIRIRSYSLSKAMLSLYHSLLLSHVRYCKVTGVLETKLEFINYSAYVINILD